MHVYLNVIGLAIDSRECRVKAVASMLVAVESKVEELATRSENEIFELHSQTSNLQTRNSELEVEVKRLQNDNAELKRIVVVQTSEMETVVQARDDALKKLRRMRRVARDLMDEKKAILIDVQLAHEPTGLRIHFLWEKSCAFMIDPLFFEMLAPAPVESYLVDWAPKTTTSNGRISKAVTRRTKDDGTSPALHVFSYVSSQDEGVWYYLGAHSFHVAKFVQPLWETLAEASQALVIEQIQARIESVDDDDTKARLASGEWPAFCLKMENNNEEHAEMTYNMLGLGPLSFTTFPMSQFRGTSSTPVRLIPAILILVQLAGAAWIPESPADNFVFGASYNYPYDVHDIDVYYPYHVGEIDFDFLHSAIFEDYAIIKQFDGLVDSIANIH
ncbi:hypothetical protein PLEOSDRAFT_1096628 [Pleurotus ostreatus PC15]|uniref:Uncharacterized protein n=1 Tax=Pleurotus ostreatus (strain PC15) TaxID=1137138 RepID=A0A067NR41_PLEO1|nr:hypothetical protein PLEOSDRAFT_1096628 [Pleurotus ostreatus PC15]